MPKNTTALSLNNRRADATSGVSGLFNVRLTDAEFAGLDAEWSRLGLCGSDVVRAWLHGLEAPAPGSRGAAMAGRPRFGRGGRRPRMRH